MTTTRTPPEARSSPEREQFLRGRITWYLNQVETDGTEEGDYQKPNEVARDAALDIDLALKNIAALRAQVQALTELSERLKSEAQIHAQEARTQRATVHECYQAVGAHVGDWHGAEPVRAKVQALTEENERLKKDAAITSLSVPLEEELSDRINEMLKHLAMQDGFTLAGIARLLSDVQRRMADDWRVIGSERRERQAAESRLREVEAERDYLRDCVVRQADVISQVKASLTTLATVVREVEQEMGISAYWRNSVALDWASRLRAALPKEGQS